MLKDKVDKALKGIGIGKDFLNSISVSQEITSKINNQIYVKILCSKRNNYQNEATVCRMEKKITGTPQTEE